MRSRVITGDLEYITQQDVDWTAFRNKTVLISGAAGFLPAYLIETFLYLNDTEGSKTKVIGLVRDLAKARTRFAQYAGNKLLQLIQQDVCEDIRLRERVHYVIHAASHASPKYFRSDPVGTIMPNLVGTANLLKLATANKVEGFLFFSTSGVYGFVEPSRYPLKEDDWGILNPTDLSSCYLESKRMGENMCVAWLNQYDVPVKIVRPAITYGPGIRLDDGRSFADFIASIVRHQDIELYSDGSALRNYCYVADATCAFFLVMLRGEVGQAYNVATDQEISVLDLAKKLVEDVFPERRLRVVMRRSATKNYLRTNFPRTAVDIGKTKALGWRLTFPIHEGFRRTVEWCEEVAALERECAP